MATVLTHKLVGTISPTGTLAYISPLYDNYFYASYLSGGTIYIYEINSITGDTTLKHTFTNTSLGLYHFYNISNVVKVVNSLYIAFGSIRERESLILYNITENVIHTITTSQSTQNGCSLSYDSAENCFYIGKNYYYYPQDKCAIYKVDASTFSISSVRTYGRGGDSYTKFGEYFANLTGCIYETYYIPSVGSANQSFSPSQPTTVLTDIDGDTLYLNRSGSYGKFNRSTLELNEVSNIGGSGVPNMSNPNDNKLCFITQNNIYIISQIEYNISYSFKNNDNTFLAGVEGKLPIQNINLTFEGATASVLLTYIDSSTDTLIFDVPTVTGKRCIGFSTQPNSQYTVLVEGDNAISLESDTTFYPVYVTHRPPATVFYINLYKNGAEPNRLDKTNYLEQVGVLEGAFREESSLVNMNVIIQRDTLPSFNYVYIPILNRYYYVTDIASVRYGLWRITLEVDVLMSYKDAIRQCIGFCERNEFQFDDNIIDRNRVIEQGADVTVTPVTNELFIDSDGSVVVQGFGLKLYTVETAE